MALSLAFKALIVPSNTFGVGTRRRNKRSNLVITSAGVDAAAAFAVSQQCIAFAAVVGAEAAYTGLNTKADVPGRPQIVTTLAGIGGVVAGAVLLSQAGSVGTTGCAVGGAAAAFLMINYILRVKDTPYDPNEWPGAKAWPAVMVLISFFDLAANVQGLLDGVGILN